MKGRIKTVVKVIVAVIVFQLVSFLGTELLAMVLVNTSLDSEGIRTAFSWGSSLVTICIAFPAFVGISALLKMKTKGMFSETGRLSGKDAAIRILLAMLPMLILYGVLLVKGLNGEDVLAFVAWNPKDLPQSILISCLLMPVVEEYMFRGIVLQNMKPYGKWLAIILSAVLFAIGHGNPVNILLSLVPGLVFAETAWKTEGIRYGIFFHILVNCFGQIIFPMVLTGIC